MTGLNDQLSRIEQCIKYCVETKRTLLIDTTKSCYKINFCDYFYFKGLSIPIITDVNLIKNIIANNSLTIYPNTFKDRDIQTWKFRYTEKGYIETSSNTLVHSKNAQHPEDIVVECSNGGGNPISLFNKLYFQQNIIDHVNSKFNKLPKKYLCIQIRNTDRSCDYKGLYEKNKTLIHSYNAIYVATDDKDSIDFFKDKGLNIFNFTEFPHNSARNLHYSSISSDTKIKNVICDIYVIAMANELLSNSIGGFINLVRNIRSDMTTINDKFN